MVWNIRKVKKLKKLTGDILYIYLVYVCLFPCVYLHHMCAQCSKMSNRANKSPGTIGVTDGCELAWWCWEPNTGPFARVMITFKC